MNNKIKTLLEAESKHITLDEKSNGEYSIIIHDDNGKRAIFKKEFKDLAVSYIENTNDEIKLSNVTLNLFKNIIDKILNTKFSSEKLIKDGVEIELEGRSIFYNNIKQKTAPNPISDDARKISDNIRFSQISNIRGIFLKKEEDKFLLIINSGETNFTLNKISFMYSNGIYKIQTEPAGNPKPAIKYMREKEVSAQDFFGVLNRTLSQIKKIYEVRIGIDSVSSEYHAGAEVEKFKGENAIGFNKDIHKKPLLEEIYNFVTNQEINKITKSEKKEIVPESQPINTNDEAKDSENKTEIKSFLYTVSDKKVVQIQAKYSDKNIITYNYKEGRYIKSQTNPLMQDYLTTKEVLEDVTKIIADFSNGTDVTYNLSLRGKNSQSKTKVSNENLNNIQAEVFSNISKAIKPDLELNGFTNVFSAEKVFDYLKKVFFK